MTLAMINQSFMYVERIDFKESHTTIQNRIVEENVLFYTRKPHFIALLLW